MATYFYDTSAIVKRFAGRQDAADADVPVAGIDIFGGGALMDEQVAAGVEDKDVKTSGYALNPKYRYEQGVCTQWGCPNGKQILEGYTVNQTVTVKVRDTAKAGDLISSVGTKGATNISGLSFTIDDDEKLKREARELAIKDAKENAAKLAEDLGVHTLRNIDFRASKIPICVGWHHNKRRFRNSFAWTRLSKQKT